MIACATALTVPGSGMGGGGKIDFWTVNLVGGDQVQFGLTPTGPGFYHFELYPATTTDGTFSAAPPLSKVDVVDNVGGAPAITLWAPYTGTFVLAICQAGNSGDDIADCRSADPSVGSPSPAAVNPMDAYTFTTAFGPGSPTPTQAASETLPFPTIAQAGSTGPLGVPAFDSGGGHNVDFWTVNLVGGDQVEIGLTASGPGYYHFELYPSTTTDPTFSAAPPLSKVDVLTNAGAAPAVTLWAPYTGKFILAVCQAGNSGDDIADCRSADPPVGSPSPAAVIPMNPYTFSTVLAPGSPTTGEAALETLPQQTIANAVSAGGFEAGGGHNIDFWTVHLVGGSQTPIGLTASGPGYYHFELYPSTTTDGTFSAAPPLSKVDVLNPNVGAAPAVNLSAPYTGTFVLAVCEAGNSGDDIADCRSADPPVGSPSSAAVIPMNPYTFTSTLSTTVVVDPTSTSIACSPTSDAAGSATTCTATVVDTASTSASTPTGTVSFTSSPATGAFGNSGSCTVQASGSPGTASCSVTFTPSASGGYTITGDYNGDSGHYTSSGQSSSVTATSSPPPQETLTVSLTGSGTGSVTGGGIDCPGTCSTSASQGSTITLSATPASKSTFVGWSGDGCSGTGTCKVTLTGAESVSATFTASPPSGRSRPPSRAEVKAALSKVLKPSGKTAKREAILKADGYSFLFSAPSPGKLVIRWYATVNGKHLLVASASVVFHAAGNATVKLKLTSKGRKLLKTSKRVKITTKASFTPTGETTTSQTKTTTLKR